MLCETKPYFALQAYRGKLCVPGYYWYVYMVDRLLCGIAQDNSAMVANAARWSMSVCVEAEVLRY